MLSNSLVLMGEIGGNDYNNALMERRSISEIRTYVPSVINAISEATKVIKSTDSTVCICMGIYKLFHYNFSAVILLLARF